MALTVAQGTETAAPRPAPPADTLPPRASSSRKPKPRVAIVHDWLVTIGGAERVLKEILAVYPEADLYTTLCTLSDAQTKALGAGRIHTSFVQRLPFAARHYRAYLPLMPLAIEQFDLSGYDVILSSSYAVAKGVLTGPDQVHVSYIHSPVRYAWDLQHAYLKEAAPRARIKGALIRMLLHYIRLWDVRTASGPDVVLANSAFVARRILKCYGRSARVVYPPVDTTKFTHDPAVAREGFYLTASRLVPYKRIQLVVEAFTAMPDRTLVVIGDGPEMKAIRAVAGPNVTLLGYRSDAELADHLRRARAFVFAAEEDFGIAPLEAQASGCPVIAYGRGGAMETIKGLDNGEPTGVHFDEQSVPSIIDAVARFEEAASRIRPEACVENAGYFTVERFRRNIRSIVEDALAERTAARDISRLRGL